MLERTKRTVALTEAGKYFLEEAKQTTVFRQCASEIHLDFEEADSSEQITRIVEGDLDLGFVRLPLENVPAEVAIKVVMREKLLVAVHKDHVLARKNRIPCAALSREELVLYSRADGKSALDVEARYVSECSSL